MVLVGAGNGPYLSKKVPEPHIPTLKMCTEIKSLQTRVISYSPFARSTSSYSCQLHNQVQNSSARWQKKCSIKLHHVPSVVEARDNSIYSFGVAADCFGQVSDTAEFCLLHKMSRINSAACAGVQLQSSPQQKYDQLTN